MSIITTSGDGFFFSAALWIGRFPSRSLVFAATPFVSASNRNLTIFGKSLVRHSQALWSGVFFSLSFFTQASGYSRTIFSKIEIASLSPLSMALWRGKFPSLSTTRRPSGYESINASTTNVWHWDDIFFDSAAECKAKFPSLSLICEASCPTANINCSTLESLVLMFSQALCSGVLPSLSLIVMQAGKTCNIFFTTSTPVISPRSTALWRGRLPALSFCCKLSGNTSIMNIMTSSAGNLWSQMECIGKFPPLFFILQAAEAKGHSTIIPATKERLLCNFSHAVCNGVFPLLFWMDKHAGNISNKRCMISLGVASPRLQPMCIGSCPERSIICAASGWALISFMVRSAGLLVLSAQCTHEG